MSRDVTDDDALRRILSDTRRIAIVGASVDSARPSHGVAGFLDRAGYEIWPVNPGHAGDRIHGREIVAGLGDLPPGIDMLDIFRRSDHVPAIVDEALVRMPDLRVIWMQIGVHHDAAARRARDAGIEVVMDRCPKIEHARLFGRR